MTFVRSNPLGFGIFETFYSPQCNLIDVQTSRAVDGFAGGAYNPTAAIVLNNQLEVDATGAAGVNVIGIVTTGKGTQAGVKATGGLVSGPGVFGTGGAPDGEGLIGTGVGTGSGVIGTGGPTNGTGVLALGSGTGDGMVSVGGAGGGRGGLFTGVDTVEGIKSTGGTTSGRGGYFIGGTPDGYGARCQGTGAGMGVHGTGGLTSGRGGSFYGGSPDGIGVYASAVGTGAAVQMVRVNGPHLNMTPRAGDPAVPSEGDIWVENDNDEIIALIDGNLHQVLDTWAHISVFPGAGPGNCTLDNENNVASIIKTAQYVELTFQRPFASPLYSSTATTVLGYYANVGSVNVAGTKTAGTLRVYIYSGVTGGLQDPTAITAEINVHIKGYFA